ncbi:MAG: zinc ribbon domain-containing protein [Candidatus Omnitrophota bacterium]
MGLFNAVLRFKDRLTKFSDEEPLSKLALAIIILLDIFILSIVSGGLSAHTSQLTSPDEYFPYKCRNIFIDKQWSQANKMDNLQNFVLSDYNNYSYRYDSAFDRSRIDKMHPICKKFYDTSKLIYENSELKKLFVQRQELAKEKNQWAQQYNRNKNIYDTSLLENIAGQSKEELDVISSSMKEQSKEIERISFEIAKINNQLNRNTLVNNLWEIIRPGDINFRDKMIRDVNKFERIYLFKELIWQLIFMLPLFIVFYIWYSKSIKKSNTIQTLISSHLLVIASIPIVIKVIEVVLDLIPYHFFKELFKLLELLHIIALWHYIVIFISIGVAMFFIYFIQKKLFNKKRLYQKRLMKGACYFCGKTLPGKINICPFCGTNQLKKCEQCNADTFVGGEYCINCGKN